MHEISNDEVEDFCEKLKDFKETLSPQQKSLLNAILNIAWTQITPVEDLTRGFDGCFEPKEAALILKYIEGKSVGEAASVVLVPRLVEGMIKLT